MRGHTHMESEYDAAFHRDKFELTTTPRGYPQRVAGSLYRTAPTMAPIGAFFYEPRVTRGDVVRLHLSPRSGI